MIKKYLDSSLIDKKFIDFINPYKNLTIALAVSGGVDSITLLYWIYILNIKCVILHVNHKLRPESDTEESIIIKIANDLNIPYKIFRWEDNKTGNIESKAREIRYNFMLDYCKKNDIKILATAHQADDQIETFFMNLGRGSGLMGLSGIRDKSIKNGILIIRPLLEIKRDYLIDYCKKNNIFYFIDSMNFDTKYTRVKIRTNRKLVQEKLNISDERILLAINNLNRTRSFIEKYIEYKISNIDNTFNFNFLFDESDEIRLRLLSSLIHKIGGKKYQPRLNSLIKIIDKLYNNENIKMTLSGCIIQRKKNEIKIIKEKL